MEEDMKKSSTFSIALNWHARPNVVHKSSPQGGLHQPTLPNLGR